MRKYDVSPSVCVKVQSKIVLRAGKSIIIIIVKFWQLFACLHVLHIQPASPQRSVSPQRTLPPAFSLLAKTAKAAVTRSAVHSVVSLAI